MAIGCGRPADRAGQSATSPSSGNIVTVKGSDTMVHLVSAWAERYMSEHPGANISVTGGGTGTGISALINGTTDICAASRNIKPEEKEMAEKKRRPPVEFTVARDAIAVIVNKNNPISELTLEQLKAIYTGAVTNWTQVGGPDQPIQVVSRESSSGTYAFFQEHVLQNEDYVATAQLLPATAAIVQAISSEPWSIGYVGLGYVAGAGGSIKAIGIKTRDASPAVGASEETVLSGAYGISRALFLYAVEPATPSIQAFVDFCTGPEGQRIVRETGYVAVR